MSACTSHQRVGNASRDAMSASRRRCRARLKCSHALHAHVRPSVNLITSISLTRTKRPLTSVFDVQYGNDEGDYDEDMALGDAQDSDEGATDENQAHFAAAVDVDMEREIFGGNDSDSDV
ncbi:hypothetical protein DFH09DRAFT_1092964 [Mycena vulgaris]|nr:hypothetical protein DFH09DRAFT_1092964 [Mycena vulgaris]